MPAAQAAFRLAQSFAAEKNFDAAIAEVNGDMTFDGTTPAARGQLGRVPTELTLFHLSRDSVEGIVCTPLWLATRRAYLWSKATLHANSVTASVGSSYH